MNRNELSGMGRRLGVSGRKSRAVAGLGLCLALGACATYHPLPLEPTPAIAPNLAALNATVDGKRMNLTQPLTIAQVAYLALENNLDLKAQRTAHNVSEAQLIQAGILPNPSLAANYGVLLGGPAAFDSWGAGITQDIKSLITISAKRKGAKYDLQSVDADLVWTEWELVSKVSLLVVDIVEGEKRAKLIQQAIGVLGPLNARASEALQRGNLDLAGIAPVTSALNGFQKDAADLEREQESRRHDLNALLGLSPDVRLDLDAAIQLQPIDAAVVQKLLPELIHKRPDLVALQLGYQSEDEKVRAAILGQFPALVFGGSYQVDTSHVRSAGPSITMDLPIFDRNQGQIAIEEATRQKLHDEYSSRLAAAVTEIDASVAEDATLERQLARLRAELPGTTRIEQQAENAYRAGNMDGRSYIDFFTTQISKQEDLVALEQLLLESRIKIAALLGAGIPEMTFPQYQQPQS